MDSGMDSESCFFRFSCWEAKFLPNKFMKSPGNLKKLVLQLFYFYFFQKISDSDVNTSRNGGVKQALN